MTVLIGFLLDMKYRCMKIKYAQGNQTWFHLSHGNEHYRDPGINK